MLKKRDEVNIHVVPVLFATTLNFHPGPGPFEIQEKGRKTFSD
jgi:hypothetical protein